MWKISFLLVGGGNNVEGLISMKLGRKSETGWAENY